MYNDISLGAARSIYGLTHPARMVLARVLLSLPRSVFSVTLSIESLRQTFAGGRVFVDWPVLVEELRSLSFDMPPESLLSTSRLWFSLLEYDSHAGTLTFTFNQELLPYLEDYWTHVGAA